jgi:hypothetical protein
MSEEPPHHRTDADEPGRRGRRVVAIVCIVVLGLWILSVGLPVFDGAHRNAKHNAASQTARGIHLGLLNYAGDHGGEFPTATTNSNDAYRKLISN